MAEQCSHGQPGKKETKHFSKERCALMHWRRFFLCLSLESSSLDFWEARQVLFCRAVV